MEPEPPKNSFARKLAGWVGRQRAASQKRRSEYLHLGGDKRLRRLMINLHPESLFSFFTSWDGMWFVFRIVVAAILIFSVLVTFAYFYYRGEAPATVLELQSCVEGRVSEFYDRTGKTLLWELKEGTECRPVQLDEISTDLIDAVISMEDKDFFNHPGYKVTSIARSVVNNLLGRPRQGGSTITQQYIKNAVLKDTDRSYERKIKEIVLVPEIEASYTKREILTAYLNTINLGNSYGGVEAASRGYFGKPAAELSLDEAAALVALIVAPSIIWEDPGQHLFRRDLVLGVMLADGKISQAEHDRAAAADTLAKVRRRDRAETVSGTPAPHFILQARRQADELICRSESECLNLAGGGYKIITTLDLTAQVQVEAAIAGALEEPETDGYDNAALAVVDSGLKEVVALTGSRGFDHPGFGQFDNITAARPPEDVWHPLVYASLLESGNEWGAGSVFYDYRTFGVRQADPHQGPVSFRRALAESVAVPTAKAAYLAGESRIAELAAKTGLGELEACLKNCALRHSRAADFTIRLDRLANFYATLADNGLYQELGYVRQIANAVGTTIYERDIDSYELLDPQTAYIVNDILADSGFKPPGLRDRGNLAFKGFSPENGRESFFFAYTPAVVLAGWVGRQAPGDGSGLQPAPAQALLVNGFLQNYGGGRRWPRPAGLRTLSVNPLSGKPGSGPADIFPADYSTDSEPATVRLDRVSGRLAGVCTPEAATVEKTSSALRAELAADDPAYHDWLLPVWANLGNRLDGSIPGQVDSLHACDDRPPSLAVSKSGNCRRSCRLTVEATAGTHDLRAIVIKANRKGVQDVSRPISGRSAEASYTYSNRQSGARHLRIEVLDEALYSDSLTIDL